jgi:hypothetical protein
MPLSEVPFFYELFLQIWNIQGHKIVGNRTQTARSMTEDAPGR